MTEKCSDFLFLCFLVGPLFFPLFGGMDKDLSDSVVLKFRNLFYLLFILFVFFLFFWVKSVTDYRVELSVGGCSKKTLFHCAIY